MTTLKRRLAQHRLGAPILRIPVYDDSVDYAAVFAAAPSAVWSIPTVKVIGGSGQRYPMTGEQSRAWRRIRRVATIPDRRARARRRDEAVQIQDYRQKWKYEVEPQ